MEILFFCTVTVYFIATILQFIAVGLKKEKLGRTARLVFAAGFVLHCAYSVWRGIVAGRIPLANQFEFASGFAWAAALLSIVLYSKLRQEWIPTACIPISFLMLSYAAFQPRDITELMPALRSAWFAFHIGSAAFSYASFAIAAGMAVRYLTLMKNGTEETETRMKQLDFTSYRMVCLGFLLLTVVILSGAIWAEQAWSTWWSWDPKETWALITWIVYAIYLHQRLRKKWQGKRMAWFAVIAIIFVLFTFAGVNVLLPGLHSYAT